MTKKKKNKKKRKKEKVSKGEIKKLTFRNDKHEHMSTPTPKKKEHVEGKKIPLILFNGGYTFYKKKNYNIPESGGNTGLYFQKYVDTWEVESGTIKIRKSDVEDNGGWLNKTIQFAKSSNVKGLLQEHLTRNKKLVEESGGRLISIVSTSHTLLGIGYDHPVENGFLFHHTLGVPFIRGTSIKGIIKSFAEYWIGDKIGDGRSVDPFICTDAIPNTMELDIDILTPHYVEYYRTEGKKWPADWENPVPISFLVLKKGVEFQLGIIPRENYDIDKIIRILEKSLETIGIGAKTSAGYGRFKIKDR